MHHLISSMTHRLVCFITLAFTLGVYSIQYLSAQTVNDLRLTHECNPGVDLYYMRVTNNTGSDIEFVWEIYNSGVGSTLSDILTAPANGIKNFMVSHPTNPTIRIFWESDYTWNVGDTSSSASIFSKVKATNPSDTCTRAQEDEVIIEFGILPVEWLYWRAKAKEDHVFLSWATASEINSSHFEIERSRDGKTFHSIGQIQSFGNTQDTRLYEYMDDQPLQGISYYRLKQVDLDGSVDYTSLIEVYFYDETDIPSVLVYPSPTSDHIRLSTQLPTASWVEITLFTPSGNLISKQLLPSTQGYNEWGIDVADFPSGMYYYRLQNGQMNAGGTFIVSH